MPSAVLRSPAASAPGQPTLHPRGRSPTPIEPGSTTARRDQAGSAARRTERCNQDIRDCKPVLLASRHRQPATSRAPAETPRELLALAASPSLVSDFLQCLRDNFSGLARKAIMVDRGQAGAAALLPLPVRRAGSWSFRAHGQSSHSPVLLWINVNLLDLVPRNFAFRISARYAGRSTSRGKAIRPGIACLMLSTARPRCRRRS